MAATRARAVLGVVLATLAFTGASSINATGELSSPAADQETTPLDMPAPPSQAVDLTMASPPPSLSGRGRPAASFDDATRHSIRERDKIRHAHAHHRQERFVQLVELTTGGKLLRRSQKPTNPPKLLSRITLFMDMVVDMVVRRSVDTIHGRGGATLGDGARS